MYFLQKDRNVVGLEKNGATIINGDERGSESTDRENRIKQTGFNRRTWL
jgi:hypothetical protein